MKKLIPWIQKFNASTIKPPLRQFCVVAIGLKKRLLYKADNCGISRQFVLYQEVWIKMGIFNCHLFLSDLYCQKVEPSRVECFIHTSLRKLHCLLSKEVLLFYFRTFSILHLFPYNEEKTFFFQISKKFPLSFEHHVYSEYVFYQQTT
jgi:hypothetical protein